MITNKNIRIIANKLGKPIEIIERDYVLDCLLYGIYHKDSKLRDLLIFKGGTSLRKVFFTNLWRFSEDLDFTLMPNTEPKFVISNFDRVCEFLEREIDLKCNVKMNTLKNNLAIQGDLFDLRWMDFFTDSSLQDLMELLKRNIQTLY